MTGHDNNPQDTRPPVSCGFTESGAICVMLGDAGVVLTHAQAMQLADGITTLVSGLKKHGISPSRVMPLSDDPIKAMFRPGEHH